MRDNDSLLLAGTNDGGVNDTTYAEVVEDNHSYAYRVSAFNNDSVESGFSNVISFIVGLARPLNLEAESDRDGFVPFTTIFNTF